MTFTILLIGKIVADSKSIYISENLFSLSAVDRISFSVV